MDSSKQNLNQVIYSIDKTLEILHQLSSFDVDVASHLNNLVFEIDNMAKLGENCHSIKVPMEVLNLIDNGKNPDEFARDLLNNCIAKNQITKGKVDAFKDLRGHLLEDLEHAFPDEVEDYRQRRI
ncbi:mediator of RNA polymerase II transcription subunit 10b-like [Solanum tuberosum]|uniref:Mediator of RNA polymerase II transcription subunit 10 n=1 Tax=Solanum tuberosum TaxID=4113 RepID=M1DT10_SOLTU|nr:PREDICTED: mediator of RNA polymerase II transcription subunit 10b-like [Solanum tuberosum]